MWNGMERFEAGMGRAKWDKMGGMRWNDFEVGMV
jgi:hypothetical protein